MAKSPIDPKEIFPEIIEDYKKIFDDLLVSIILYGSAAGPDYRPGRSDINFMIVLKEEGIDQLERAFKTISKWEKKKVALPLFLTKQYVKTSTDVYPIEYLNFQRNHALVYGEDILKELSFDSELIRLQCEREIKGKLLILREAYLESKGDARTLKGIISRSVTAIIAVFEALLFLKGEELPVKRIEVITKSCQVLDLDDGLFNRLLEIKDQKVKPSSSETNEIYKKYLKEIRKLSLIADRMGGLNE